jgi:hypothetical protein
VITPRNLRKQFQTYIAAGFHPVSIEPRAGGHWKVCFAEFAEPQFLTIHANEPRAMKNNLARFRRLTQGVAV